jgi:hypothetical protein
VEDSGQRIGAMRGIAPTRQDLWVPTHGEPPNGDQVIGIRGLKPAEKAAQARQPCRP